MKWSPVLAHARVAVVTLSLGLAFCSLGALTHHYFSAARSALAERERIKAEMVGLIERLADVEASLNTVSTYRNTIDRMTVREFEGVLERTGLKSSSEAGIRSAMQSYPAEGDGSRQSNERIYSDALVYGGVIDRLANARIRADGLSDELKGTASLLAKRRAILASIPSIMPAQGWISSEFGVRASPFHEGDRMHNGIDVAGDPGTVVVAPADGVVTFAGSNGSYGKFLRIDHGYGIETRYGHNSTLSVKSGDKVVRGQPIAQIGNTGRSTGPHLHYEVRVHDQAVNPRRFFFDSTPPEKAPTLAAAAVAKEAPMGGDSEKDSDEARDTVSAKLEDIAVAATSWDAPVFTVSKGLVGRLAPGALRHATTADLALATVLLILLSIAAATMHMPDGLPFRRREALSPIDAYFDRQRRMAGEEPGLQGLWRGVKQRLVDAVLGD